MIVWRGKGLLVPHALMIGGVLANMIYSFLHLNVNKSTDSIILGCMLGILTAAVNYLLTKKNCFRSGSVYD